MNGSSLLRGALARGAALVDRREVIGLLLAALCFLVATAWLQPIWDSDVGWHLALGRHIAESGAVPDAEPFTHTAFGAPMVAHEWLTQLLYHGVAEAVGLSGLRLAHAGLLALLLVLFFRMLRRAGVPRALALVAVLTWVVIAQGRFALRPQTLSLLVTMLLVDRIFVRRPPLTGRQLAGFFAVGVLWANLHSAAVMLPGLVALYVGAEVVQRRLGWRTPESTDLGGGELRRVLALGALTGAAVFVTPNHLRLVPYMIESNRINRKLSGEWFSVVDVWLTSSGAAWDLVVLAIAAVCIGVAVVVGRRRHSLTTLVLVSFLTLLPLSSHRFVDLYFAPLLFGFAELARALRRSRLAPLPGQVVSVVCVALVLVCALQGAVLRLDRALFAVWRGGSQDFAPVAFPVGAVRFLDGVRLDCRMFNPERWGGYLLHRTFGTYPIFIDGRWITIGEPVTRAARRIERRLPGTFSLLKGYEVDLLLVPRGWMTRELAEREGWLPIFENFNAGVYLRREAGSAANLRRVAAYYETRGIPFDLERGFDGRAALEANPVWAGVHQVQRRHVEHFRVWGTPVGISPRHVVDRW